MSRPTPPPIINLDDVVSFQRNGREESGQVIGQERRDSRYGTSIDYVCVKIGDGLSYWMPTADVIAVTADPTRERLAELVATVGKQRVERLLGQL